MRLGFTLSRYIGRQFLINFAIVMGVILLLVLLVDVVELLRRASGRDETSFAVVMELALLKLPDMSQKVVPFAVLIGGILMLSRMTRTHELVVARASGVSVWQFLLPAVISAVMLGGFILAVYNPLAAALLSKYEQMEAKYLTGRTSMLAVSSSGLWLRQRADVTAEERGGETIVHALRASQHDMELFDVIIFRFDGRGHFIQRVDADHAQLEEGHWNLDNVLITAPDEIARRKKHYMLPTELTVGQIQDSFSSPDTMSVWALSGFIDTLEAAGFSALRHRLHWHSMLSLPLFLASLLFISASFALRPTRFGGTGVLLSMGVFTGFMIYFATDVIHALGLSGTLPVSLAAWSPAVIVTLVGIALLLHFEDG